MTLCMMKIKDKFNKPFKCAFCNEPAVFFDSDKKWYCGIEVGFGTMNSKGYCKNDKREKD